jgi:hypothetical protein
MIKSEIFSIFISKAFDSDYTSDLIFSLLFGNLYSASSLFPSFWMLLLNSGLILKTLMTMNTNDLSESQKILVLLHNVLRYYKL